MPEAFADTSSGPVRYVQRGEGADVVLLHGAMTSLEDMLLGPFEKLAERYRVTAFDRPGHGATSRVRLEGAPSRQMQRVREACAALGLRRPVVVGQSFGAILALDLGLSFPGEVSGVLAISPIAFPELRLEHLLFGPRALVGAGDMIAYGPGPVIDAMLMPLLWQVAFAPQRMPRRFREGYPFALANGPDQMLALGEEAVLAVPDLAAIAARYPTCRVPVAIMAGTSDLVADPRRHAQRLARLVPGATLELLPGLGHMMHHFAIDAVARAVDGLCARPAPAN